MPVKSSIMTPEDGAKFDSGSIAVRGIAWAKRRSSAWMYPSTAARAGSPPNYRLQAALRVALMAYRLETPPRRDDYTVLSRATDTAGRVQPFVPEWNPSGYLWNGIDRIGVTVEAKA